MRFLWVAFLLFGTAAQAASVTLPWGETWSDIAEVDTSFGETSIDFAYLGPEVGEKSFFSPTTGTTILDSVYTYGRILVNITINFAGTDWRQALGKSSEELRYRVEVFNGIIAFNSDFDSPSWTTFRVSKDGHLENLRIFVGDEEGHYYWIDDTRAEQFTLTHDIERDSYFDERFDGPGQTSAIAPELIAEVPLPSSASLLLASVAGIVALRRRAT